MGLFPLTVRNRDWTRDARAVPPIGARVALSLGPAEGAQSWLVCALLDVWHGL
jgi:hypothetical protein